MSPVDTPPDLPIETDVQDGRNQLTPDKLAALFDESGDALSTAKRAQELGVDPYLVGDDGEDLDPDELVKAEYRGRTFMVPRGKYLEATIRITNMNANERLNYLFDTFEQAERIPVTALYAWGGEASENAAFVNTLAQLGLHSRLASSKKVGEVMGSTAMPIVYARLDAVLNKTEFERAANAAASGQSVYGNKRVAQAIEEICGLKNAHKRAFIVAFEETIDADGNQSDEPRMVVGLFVYKEPRDKIRGPEARTMNPEELAERFSGLQTHHGRLVGFDLDETRLADVATYLKDIFRNYESYVETLDDEPFDNDLETPVSLVDTIHD